MAQGARKQSESRLATELTKRMQRDRSKLERAYTAMEESGESDAFLQSLVDATTEAAQDVANEDRQRVTPNQPSTVRKQRKAKRATRNVNSEPKKQYQPFSVNSQENPLLIEDDSLSSGIYPAANDEEELENIPGNVEQEVEQGSPDQQYATTLAKNKQSVKQQYRSGKTSLPHLPPARNNDEAKQQLRKLRPYLAKINQKLKKVNQKLRPLVRRKRIIKLSLHSMRVIWAIFWTLGGLLALFGVGEVLMVVAKGLGSYIKNLKRIIKRLDNIIDPLKKQQTTLKKQLIGLTKIIRNIQQRQQLQRVQQAKQVHAAQTT